MISNIKTSQQAFYTGTKATKPPVSFRNKLNSTNATTQNTKTQNEPNIKLARNTFMTASVGFALGVGAFVLGLKYYNKNISSTFNSVLNGVKDVNGHTNPVLKFLHKVLPKQQHINVLSNVSNKIKDTIISAETELAKHNPNVLKATGAIASGAGASVVTVGLGTMINATVQTGKLLTNKLINLFKNDETHPNRRTDNLQKLAIASGAILAAGLGVFAFLKTRNTESVKPVVSAFNNENRVKNAVSPIIKQVESKGGDIIPLPKVIVDENPIKVFKNNVVNTVQKAVPQAAPELSKEIVSTEAQTSGGFSKILSEMTESGSQREAKVMDKLFGWYKAGKTREAEAYHRLDNFLGVSKTSG